MSGQHPHEEEALGKAYDARLARRLLTYLRPYRARVALAVALSLLVASFSLIQPLFVRWAIDHTIPNGDHRELALLLGAFLGAVTIEYAIQFLYILAVNSTGQYAMFDLRIELFDHLQRLSLSFFDKTPVGRLMTRVTGDIEVLNELFSEGITHIFGALFLLIGILGILLWMSVPLTLLALSVLPLMLIISRYFRVWSREGFRAVRTRIARLNSFLQENVTGLQTVQAFVREERNLEKFKRLNKDHYDANIQTILAYAVFFPAVEVVSALGMGAVLWYGGIQVLSGALTLGTLVAFMEYLFKFFQPIRELSAQYGTLQSAMASSERIFKLLDEPISIAGPESPHPIVSARGRVVFDQVDFEYRTGEPVLHQVSFVAEPGERIAFVGATGSGKSTVMSLLCRFYDVIGGRILIDGVDLRDWNLANLRANFGIVLQDVFLFSGTVLDNITLRDPRISRADAERVIRELGMEALVSKLPQGLDSPLGERGRSLSVGERQLVSFARALAHDPRILVLDEATSSVDTETERTIQRALARLTEGRTSLIVAHRLSTIHNCDRILVMSKGRVAEMGTHEELLAARGLYHRLYELQYKTQEALA
ncbi:MAG: ABC transporter ATP-binding protein [Candidatus Omnitrophica bacterium]|nr:putative ABC transporter ATP-binding protein [bacterium]NUN96660.1 ABC transporter ATP-binding protein [Candidatus Omnitrophota bacterium]